MKSLKTSSLLLAFIFICHAQTILGQTLTPDWFYQIGDTTAHVGAEELELFSVPEEGVDMVWDFSTAIPNEDSYLEFKFLALTDLTHADKFPSASFGAMNKDSIEFFYEIKNDSLYSIGTQYAPNGGLNYTKKKLILATPFSLGDTYEAEVAYDVIVNEQTISTTEYVEKISLVGSGTVITPVGEFDNCVLIKKEETHDNQENRSYYHFYKDNLSNRILTMGLVEDSISSLSWMLNFETLSTTKEQAILDIKVLNLGNQTLMIDTPSNMDLQFQLFDLSGRVITNFEQFLVEGENSIDISNLNLSGTFVLLIFDEKTGAFKSLKLSFY